MGPDLEEFTHVEADPLLLEYIGGGYQPKLSVAGEKIFGGPPVLLVENAAGRVDQPPSRLDQPRRSSEQRPLLANELAYVLRSLSPFHVGIAAQRPQSAARRIDQYAVDLAGETLDARIVDAFDTLRMNVRKAGARQSRLQPREALRRNVERIQPPGRAHQGSERQRLAPRSRAEVDDHLAALWRNQMAQ